MAVTSGKRPAGPKKRTGRKTKAKKTVKRRSATALALTSPLYRKRVVKSAKAYSRKAKARRQGGESEEA
jgi:stalled ribosome alternative rescue factor ArfA